MKSFRGTVPGAQRLNIGTSRLDELAVVTDRCATRVSPQLTFPRSGRKTVVTPYRGDSVTLEIRAAGRVQRLTPQDFWMTLGLRETGVGPDDVVLVNGVPLPSFALYVRGV